MKKIIVAGFIAMAVLCVGAVKSAPKQSVTFNAGVCIDCGGHYELDYKCGSTYVFRCEDCGHYVQTHT